MNIIIIDLLFIAIAFVLLLIVPLYVERKHRQVWQGCMKRAALRHCVLGNSEYGQQRYNAIGGAK